MMGVVGIMQKKGVEYKLCPLVMRNESYRFVGDSI